MLAGVSHSRREDEHPIFAQPSQHPDFLEGRVTVFDETPALFQFTARRDRASVLLGYIGEISEWAVGDRRLRSALAASGNCETAAACPRGRATSSRTAPDSRHARAKSLHHRHDHDAHQSLFATRMQRTTCFASPHVAFADLFPWKCGAAFDTSMRSQERLGTGSRTAMRANILSNAIASGERGRLHNYPITSSRRSSRTGCRASMSSGFSIHCGCRT